MFVCKLQAGNEEVIIEVKILTFSLENMPGTDYVIIYGGPDSSYTRLASFYGYIRTPFSLNSTNSWLNIVFRSDGENEQSGFNLTYTIKSKCKPDGTEFVVNTTVLKFLLFWLVLFQNCMSVSCPKLDKLSFKHTTDFVCFLYSWEVLSSTFVHLLVCLSCTELSRVH